MQQNGISTEELDQVFQFKADGFEIHNVPGTSKKEKTQNAYVLTGLGTFLTKNDRTFTDAMARDFCKTIGCFDPPNHAKYLKEKGSEFSGDKSRGYLLSNVGVKRGAMIVRELAAKPK
jgi:biotin operon repressor